MRMRDVGMSEKVEQKADIRILIGTLKDTYRV